MTLPVPVPVPVLEGTARRPYGPPGFLVGDSSRGLP